MKKIILNFEKDSKLHIGEELSNYISSDRLYSFIINALSHLGIDDFDEVIKMINSDVLISSAFLGLKIQKNNEVIKLYEFIPKPKILVRDSNENDEKSIDNRKKYKNVSWITRNTLNKFNRHYEEEYNGEEIRDVKFNYSYDNGIIFGDEYYLDNDELSEELKRILLKYAPIKTECIQRNSINRFTKESRNTYYDYYSVLTTKEKNDYVVSPYFYFYINDEKNVLKNYYLKSLSCISIGGKRSLGAGLIDNIEIQECEDFTLSRGKFYMNLSMVYPLLNEISSLYKYTLERRNGFIYSNGSTNIKKPTIRMIKEGSLFSSKIEGDICYYNIEGLQHKVYVYGKAFLYPIGGDK